MKTIASINYRHQVRLVGKALLLLTCLLSLTSYTLAQNSYRLSKAPFYKTFKKVEPKQGAPIAYFPVRIDQQTTSEFFYQGRENVLQPLIYTMNSYLDSLAWSPAIQTDQLSAVGKGAPYLFVGSAESEIAPPSARVLREEYDTYPPMVMHADKPSKEWKAKLAVQLEQSRAEYALLFWIGFNEYPKAKKGVFKKKVVLGTGYEPEIRFLSDELEPVEVLQLSGILINKNGDIIKAGSEAFLYEDTPFWIQVLEAEKSITDKTIENAITNMRRDELPGRPLAWKVAMDHLLKQLAKSG